MKQQWSLKEIYSGFDSPALAEDMKKLNDYLTQLNKTPSNLEAYLTTYEDAVRIYSKLISFASLTAATNTSDASARKLTMDLEKTMNTMSIINNKLAKHLMKLSPSEREKQIKSSDFLSDLEYFIQQTIREGEHMLSEEEECVIANMSMTGSKAWSKLFRSLTSTLEVLMPNGERLPITVVRSLASNKDPHIRKQAYEAELASYRQIEESMAYVLNGIKGEVLTVSEMRGYESPLQMTLDQTNISKKTLDAMLKSIQDHFEVFRRYIRAKAKLLGHKKMPFYDLFAPIGDDKNDFTYEEAGEFVIKSFQKFSPKMGDIAKRAIDDAWIDVAPRTGKVSGAFCHDLFFLDQFRVLLNFNGTLSNVTTMAHELGHGYHAIIAKDEKAINHNYPMTLAETASIFCETIVTNDVFNETKSIGVLDAMLENASQVTLDIFSRYRFESEVFRRRQHEFLSADDLKNIMLDAQKEAYGDALDEQALHPYMWLIKPHYYEASLNFYNFPYAFGMLFANGLYAIYLQKPEGFHARYDHLLASAGKMSVEDACALMDIDCTSQAFWDQSIELLEKRVVTFEKMVEERC